MQSIEIEEEESQTATVEKTKNSNKYVLSNKLPMLILVFFVMTTKMPGLYIDYDTLSRHTIITNALLYFIGFGLFIITIILYASTSFYQSVKFNKQKKIDINSETEEQAVPITKGFRIFRIIMWIFYANTFICLVVYLMHTAIIILSFI